MYSSISKVLLGFLHSPHSVVNFSEQYYSSPPVTKSYVTL